MDKHKLSISFKSDRLHIYDYLKNTPGIKDNISAYICTLIEKDMQSSLSSLSDNDLKTLVHKYVKMYISDLPTHCNNQATLEAITSEDINLINNLF